jgi:hypothetical protein
MVLLRKFINKMISLIQGLSSARNEIAEALLEFARLEFVFIII